jgi:hypothetical protein
MPGSTGTGQPLSLRCSQCKKGGYHRDAMHPANQRGRRLQATGRTKPLPQSQRHHSVRTTDRLIEVECLDCEHLMWTKHRQAERLLRMHELRQEVEDELR